ncbi:hypothetical protein KEM56_006656 [Ascosphaera pollenicola]|nr:hypothetical protein KEM56_006656 [Ascosphaera pollenicola]
MTSIVLGAQFGDEGKGKITDLLAQESTLCCRAAGGHNAGHTIVHDGVTYDFHILPSGLCAPKCINLIGTATVVHVPSFFRELAAIESKGLTGVRERVFISDRAQVCFDLHSVVDGLEEAALAGRKVGTTGKGIGPCYSDKAARRGVRIGELFEEGVLERKLRIMAADYKRRFGDLMQYDIDEELARFAEYIPKLKPHVVDQVSFMNKHNNYTSTLVEAANALMLDIDNGTYPYVTSSNTGIGGVIQGLYLNPTKITGIIGVVKAYLTRVGSGPMPTEQLNEAGDKLQSVGREFGVTTGRKRRCGWLDMVMLRFSCAINHYTALNLTKLDVLDDFEEIQVGVAYKIDGKVLDSCPASVETLSKVEVVYETLPGWKSNTMGAKTWNDLPVNAQKYVQYIEKQTGVPVRWIGTGPAREDMIDRS